MPSSQALPLYPGVGNPPLNSFSRSGAEQLADRIRKYWSSRGYQVAVRVENTRCPKSTDALWVTRSNMVNGHPVGGRA